jgi:hypothetical protein
MVGSSLAQGLRLAVSAAALCVLPAHAVVLKFLPSEPVVRQGPVLVDVVLEGLDHNRLGAFDVALTYDPAVLQAVAVEIDTWTAPMPLVPRSSSADWLAEPGRIHVASTGVLDRWLLGGIEAPPPVLRIAQLTFDLVAGGVSPLSADALGLSNLYGQPLAATVEDGRIAVLLVEPSMLALLVGAGALVLAAHMGRRRHHRRRHRHHGHHRHHRHAAA